MNDYGRIMSIATRLNAAHTDEERANILEPLFVLRESFMKELLREMCTMDLSPTNVEESHGRPYLWSCSYNSQTSRVGKNCKVTAVVKYRPQEAFDIRLQIEGDDDPYLFPLRQIMNVSHDPNFVAHWINEWIRWTESVENDFISMVGTVLYWAKYDNGCNIRITHFFDLMNQKRRVDKGLLEQQKKTLSISFKPSVLNEIMSIADIEDWLHYENTIKAYEIPFDERMHEYFDQAYSPSYTPQRSSSSDSRHTLVLDFPHLPDTPSSSRSYRAPDNTPRGSSFGSSL